MEIFISIIKKIINISIIIIFISAAYFFLFLKGNKDGLPSFLPFIDKTSSTASSTAKNLSSEGEIIKLQQTLYELERIDINSDFFDSPVFDSLNKPFKNPIPTLQQARENPFAPIGE